MNTNLSPEQTQLHQTRESIPKPESNYRVSMVLMICGAITLNYLSRVNIGTAAPILRAKLNLTAPQMGIIMSAFFWSYTLMMIPVGALLNKFGPKKILGIFCLGWGIVTMLTGSVSGFLTFLIVRIGLGITQAPAYPAASRVVSVWVPKRERTLASAAFDCCARLGNLVAPPLVAFIIAIWGWRASFIATGILSVFYGLFWLKTYKEPGEHTKITKSELSYIQQDEVISSDGTVKADPIPMHKLFTYRVMWQLTIAYALYMYVWNVFNFWLPSYLMDVRGLSLQEMGVAAMIPYTAGFLLELLGGFVTDRMYRKGISLNTLRRTMCGFGMIGSAIALFFCTRATTAVMAIFWLSCSMGIFSFGASNVWSVPADIAPYGQAGGVAAIYSFVGNFGSLVAPIVSGFFVASRYGYDGALVACVIAAAVGALLFAVSTYDRLKPKEG